MNVSSDPALAAVQTILIAGIFFWWVYLAGLGLGLVVLVRAVRLRRVAAFTIGLQFAPLMTLLILFALAFVGLAAGQAIPVFFANTLAFTALLAGPAATVWLIFATVTSRAAKASGGR